MYGVKSNSVVAVVSVPLFRAISKAAEKVAMDSFAIALYAVLCCDEMTLGIVKTAISPKISTVIRTSAKLNPLARFTLECRGGGER